MNIIIYINKLCSFIYCCILLNNEIIIFSNNTRITANTEKDVKIRSIFINDVLMLNPFVILNQTKITQI